MTDAQSEAEQFDEDVTGVDDPVLSDEAEAQYPPDQLQGVPFADADITDESVAERAARENPEVWEQHPPTEPSDGPADEQLEQIIEIPPD